MAGTGQFLSFKLDLSFAVVSRRVVIKLAPFVFITHGFAVLVVHAYLCKCIALDYFSIVEVIVGFLFFKRRNWTGILTTIFSIVIMISYIFTVISVQGMESNCASIMWTFFGPLGRPSVLYIIAFFHMSFLIILIKSIFKTRK